MKLFPPFRSGHSRRLSSGRLGWAYPIAESSELDSDKVRKPELLGVSVHHLATVFLPSVLEHEEYNVDSRFMDIENLNQPTGFVREKGAHTKCPIDGNMGSAYVHTLSGQDHVGPSTAMLSWTWKYTVSDVVDTLKDYCEENELDPKQTYIWMCCLCINQHRVVAQVKNSGMLVDKSGVDFHDELKQRVNGIRRVLAMMGPWDDPEYLKRVWCIFECFTAIQNGMNVTIVMPPRERERMSKILLGSTDDSSSHIPGTGGVSSANGDAGGSALQQGRHLQGVDALYRALANVSVENANATVPEDKRQIMKILSESKLGFDMVNKQVADYLRCWVRRTIDVIVSEQVDRMERASRMEAIDAGDAEYTMSQYRLAHAAFCNNVAMLFHRNGDLKAAIDMFRRSQDIYESELGAKHAYTAATLSSIGSVLMAQGQHDMALKVHQRALEIQKALPEAQQNNLATTYTNLAQVLHGKGEFDKALKMYKKAADLSEHWYGSKHQATAPIYSCMGSLLLLKGCHSKALKSFQSALEIFKAALGNHPDTAKTYCDIGRVYHGQGEFVQAIEMQDEAISIQEQLLGNHVQTATSYLNKGRSLQALGRYDDALNAYTKANNMLTRVVGPKHPTSAATFSSLGSLYQATKRYTEAIEMHKKALKYFVGAFGNDHFATARVYSDFGSVLHDRNGRGDQERALALLWRAQIIQELSLDPMHPSLATTYVHLGRVLKAKGDYSQGMKMLQKALTIQSETLGKSHPTTASTHSGIASILVAQKKKSDALAEYKKCLDIQRKTLGPDHPSTLKTARKVRRF